MSSARPEAECETYWRESRAVRCGAFQAGLHASAEEVLHLDALIGGWRLGMVATGDAVAVIGHLRRRHAAAFAVAGTAVA